MRWVIGDIHGMIRPLEALLRAIRQHDDAAELLFVGDFVNRGPESKAVVELLMSLDNAKCVRGNHDDVFDQVMSGQSYAGSCSFSRAGGCTVSADCIGRTTMRWWLATAGARPRRCAQSRGSSSRSS